MMKHKLLVLAGLSIAAIGVALCLRAASKHPGGEVGEAVIAESESDSGMPLEELSLTVIYDNNPYADGLETAWGFSCFIEGTDNSILFDTGGDAQVLLANMDSLSIKPDDIDAVILSHAHGDHTGGLKGLLEENPHVTVYVPESFSASFKKQVRESGAKVAEVGGPAKICKNVYSVGELGGSIKEQSLVIHTDGGAVVITGCAHPGIVSIVDKTRDLHGENVLLVMGGFHLLRSGEGEIRNVIAALRKAGVVYAGPCHCSGENARRLFEEEYGDNCIMIGVGRVLAGSDLR